MDRFHLKENKNVLTWVFRILDIILIELSFYFSKLLFSYQYGIDRFEFPAKYFIFISVYLVFWLFLSIRSNLYSSKRVSYFRYEVWDLIHTTFISLVLAIIFTYLLNEAFLDRMMFLYFWCIQLLNLISTRLLLREILKFIRRNGYNFRRVLFVGFNERAFKLKQVIDESPEFGIRILGYIDEKNEIKNNFFAENDLQYLGPLDRLESILRSDVVDAVLITLPVKSFYSEINKIVVMCETAGIEVIMPVNLFSQPLFQSVFSHFGHMPVLSLFNAPPMNLQMISKRLLDIFISIFLILLWSPLFILLSLSILISSRGPLLFRQERVGYNGRKFILLKFRTMVENAEELKKDLIDHNELEGPVFKIRKDPRITPVGRLIRSISLDELPQLINVLIGDMSLVGPRPPLPDEVDQYDLKHRRRLSMKPGITCIWQVSGRNDISFEKWMELDKQYIENWSLWLDIKILLKTIPVIFRGKGI